MTQLSEITIREWFDKFRQNLVQNDWLEPLKEIVQMDEAFFGKSLVVAAKDIKQKRIVLRVLSQKNMQKQHAVQFVSRHVEPGSDFFTDGGGWYRGIQKNWPVNHRYDVHSKWEFGHTSEIEGVIGNLRTYIRRQYHHVTRSKLSDLVAEFEANFNHPEIFENPRNYLQKSLFLVPTC